MKTYQVSAIESSEKSLGIDKGLASLKGKRVPLCPFGCRYVFSSHADALRHCHLMDHTAIRGWQSKLPKFKYTNVDNLATIMTSMQH